MHHTLSFMSLKGSLEWKVVHSKEGKIDEVEDVTMIQKEGDGA